MRDHRKASATVPGDNALRIVCHFDFQPTLTGELVELRPLRADDYKDLYVVAADPLIWQQHPVKDRHEQPVFQQFFQEALASGGALIAIDATTHNVIGSSRYHGFDPVRNEVEIGWTFLARTHWGGAYNGEMKRLMLRHAFRFVSRVIFLVGPENLRSQRAVQKIGAVRVESRCDARGRESFLYEITAENFVKATGALRAPHSSG
jgi:N-acetyltransferase